VKDKISFSWKEKIKSKQMKKDLEENKENIINPNTEDTKTDEEFQKVIETAVAEKAEEEEKEKEEKAEEKKEEKKETKKEEKKEDKSEEKQEEKAEASVFDETASLDTPSEKDLDDKEKKMIDRIIIDATTLKNG
jgi:hypothetical protein